VTVNKLGLGFWLSKYYGHNLLSSQSYSFGCQIAVNELANYKVKYSSLVLAEICCGFAGT
jgi:hypothetical protein